MTPVVVTGVFYDTSRRGWVVEYDNRPDRQAHFGADKARAIGHAIANGWDPPTGWTSGAGVYGPGDLDDTD